MLDWITQIFNYIKEAYNLSCSSLSEFLTILNNNVTAINNASNGINGTISGINFVRFIGAFRWIVGDFIFSIFYMTIIVGISYTVFVLVKAIVEATNISGGLLGGIKSLFFKG